MQFICPSITKWVVDRLFSLDVVVSCLSEATWSVCYLTRIYCSFIASASALLLMHFCSLWYINWYKSVTAYTSLLLPIQALLLMQLHYLLLVPVYYCWNKSVTAFATPLLLTQSCYCWCKTVIVNTGLVMLKPIQAYCRKANHIAFRHIGILFFFL